MDEIKAAAAARLLLDDPTLQAAFDVVRLQQIEAFSRRNATDAEILAAHNRLVAVDDVIAAIVSVVDSGKIAARKLEKGQHLARD